MENLWKGRLHYDGDEVIRLHGKEVVDGSSPSEGFEKPRKAGLFR
jgi:hypothetical protein